MVDEKVNILHFHDEDKSWWSSILYHSVANPNRYLYILVLILPEEKKHKRRNEREEMGEKKWERRNEREDTGEKKGD